jgi:hypothetical protein
LYFLELSLIRQAGEIGGTKDRLPQNTQASAVNFVAADVYPSMFTLGPKRKWAVAGTATAHNTQGTRLISSCRA